jgi:hypothetical protein
MHAFNRFATILGFALVTTQAQAVDFSFISGAGISQAMGNSYSATLDGLTITASAWSSTAKQNRFEQAALTFSQGYGMGVCSSDEGAFCTAKNFSNALGNKGADDLILIRFSSAVSLQSLSLLQLGSDSDLRLWAGSGAFSPAGLNAGQLGAATLYNNSSNLNYAKDISLAAFSGSYDWLAVAARIGQKNDFATLQSLSLAVNPVAQAVPEAATWMTMLAGLGLVGFAVRRRAQT